MILQFKAGSAMMLRFKASSQLILHKWYFYSKPDYWWYSKPDQWWYFEHFSKVDRSMLLQCWLYAMLTERLNTQSCLSPQQIVPSNSSLKSVYIEKQYLLFLHTKFKNYVYILKMSKWVKTKQYSPSPFVVNINVTVKTWGLLVLVCDHWYRNFF